MEFKIAFLIVLVSVTNIFASHTYSQTAKVTPEWEILLTTDSSKNNLLALELGNELQQTPVSGIITNASTGEPMAGVNIQIKGTTIGTISGADGKYSIPSGVDQNAILIFSFIGYVKQEVVTASKTVINVALNAVMTDLGEVVVIAYGTVRKKDLTGTVSSIKPEEMFKTPTSNVMEAVQGKITGVLITKQSGGAGAGTNITIRGNRSINAGNNPLYIVDGVQYTNIEDINPDDVLSMDILRDASSTAIYGSRGANGVVLITTKKGSEGKVKVTAGYYYGISNVAGFPYPMNSADFIDFKREAYRTYGRWKSPADDPLIFSATELEGVNSGYYFDYPGTLLSQGSQEDFVIGVSGGTDKTKVYFSFDYFKEKGVMTNDYSNRYTMRINVDQTIFKNFKVGIESQLTRYDQNLRKDNVLDESNAAIPYLNPYDEDGNLMGYPGFFGLPNTLLNEVPGKYINEFLITRLLTVGYIEWKPFNGLVIKSHLGIVNESNRNGHFEDQMTFSRMRSTGSLSSITNKNLTDLTWENIVNYQKVFGNHSINLTALTSYLSYRSENSSLSGTEQLLASQSFHSMQSNPANILISSNYVGSNLQSVGFRFDYSFKEKYLLTFTGREDGSSVLAPINRWQFFPSGAIAWRIIEEEFMKKLPVISDLKLRGSIGVSGNSAVKPYQTQSGLMLIPFHWNDQTALAYGLDAQTGNINLNWELTTVGNFGIDFGFLNNRISGSIDIYDSKTKDLLYLQNLPRSTGVRSVLTNSGKTRNSGIEISLRTVNIQYNNLSWISNISFTRNRERIVFLPNGNDIGNELIIGYPVNSFYDYKKIGIWQTPDLELATSYGYKPGDIRVQDVNKDGKITALDDRMVVGSETPDYSIGFSNDIKFKNFDLNIFGDARIGQTFESAYALSYNPDAISNVSKVDYWTPENPTNAYPQPDSRITREGLVFVSTLGYQDGSFLKVRNITLGYTLPSSLTQKLHITSIRGYISAKNYIRFSKVKDYDPEGDGSISHPLTKLIVTGLNIEF